MTPTPESFEDARPVAVSRLKRKLRNARMRALYWSGNPTFTGHRFSVKKNRNGWEGYELAMCDVRGLCDQIEELTGVRPKQSDPKRAFGQRFLGIMAKVAERNREQP